MADKRKDHKGRTLKVGESQRKDLCYQYRYTDLLGNRHTIYSWRLLASDKTPSDKKDGKSLREKESEIQLMLAQGMTGLGTEITLNEMFEYYISNKKHKGKNLTQNTIRNYRVMYDKHIRNTVLGNMKVSDIKKVNIVRFYEELQENQISYGTITFFQKVLSSVFNMALDNEMIRNNPTKRHWTMFQVHTNGKKPLLEANKKNFWSTYINRIGTCIGKWRFFWGQCAG